MKIPRAEPVVWEPTVLQACLNGYLKSGKSDTGAKIAFLALGAFAGMHPSEIEGVVGERDGLQWEDIDFKHRPIRIRPEVAGKLAGSDPDESQAASSGESGKPLVFRSTQ